MIASIRKQVLQDNNISFHVIVTKVIALMAMCVFLISFASSVQAEALDWKYVFNPLGEEGKPLYAVEYGGGKFVAGGKNGVIMFTEDGQTWMRGLNDNKSDIYSIVYGNGRFVAAGKGVIIYSEDGIYWQPSDYKNVSSLVEDVAFGNGKFVAVNDYGEIYHSDDAKSWIRYEKVFSEGLKTVAYDNGKFMTAGPSKTLISTDGLSWIYYDDSSFPAGVISASVKADNKYKAIGQRNLIDDSSHERYTQYFALTSNDGVSWIPDYFLFGITWDTVLNPKNNYICRGITAISPEGKMWIINTDITINSVKVAYGNCKALAVKTNGVVKCYPATTADWYFPKTEFSLRSVTYGNGIFVAVGPDNIFVISEDGEKWTSSKAAEANYNITDVAAGSGKFVAVGHNGIIVSPDGKEWQPVALSGVTPALDRVVYENGIFVAAGQTGHKSGQGIILTSTDGVNWTKRELEKVAGITSLAFGNGRFMAGSSNGLLLVSPDGVIWYAEALPAGLGMNSINGIAFGNGKFFVASGDNKSAITEDGIRWKSVSPSLYGFKPTSVAYGGGHFIATGRDSIFTSEDGLSWEDSGFKCKEGLSGITYGKGRFVIIHSKGSILACRAGETLKKESKAEALKDSPGEIQVIMNGSDLTFEQPPLLINGRVMVPLRDIFESLGAKVYWEESTQTVTATKGKTVIALRIGDSNAGISGKSVIMDPVAQVINGRTLVPVRFVSEALNAKIDWDEANNTVIITTVYSG